MGADGCDGRQHCPPARMAVLPAGGAWLTQGQKARCDCRGSNGSNAPGFSGEKLLLLKGRTQCGL